MNRFALWAMGAGLVLFVGLVVYQGAGDIASAVAGAGWGLAWVTVYQFIPMLAEGLGWRCLLPVSHRPPLRTVVWARWIGQSINNLLPVARVGGEWVRAGLLARRGRVPGPIAGASVVVDMTATVLTQALFSLLGIGLLVLRIGGGRIALALVLETVMLGVLVGGFWMVQRRGLFGTLARRLEKVVGGQTLLTLVGGADALDTAISNVYRNRRAVSLSIVWCLTAWVLGTGEVWLALSFLGHPVSLTDAVILESLSQAVRAASFAIPGALGTQEGGLLVLGGLLSLPPDIALGLSIIKRVRELALGVPGIVAWQGAQTSSSLLRTAPAGHAPDPPQPEP